MECDCGNTVTGGYGKPRGVCDRCFYLDGYKMYGQVVGALRNRRWMSYEDLMGEIGIKLHAAWKIISRMRAAGRVEVILEDITGETNSHYFGGERALIRLTDRKRSA